jgi:hypothetical protein
MHATRRSDKTHERGPEFSGLSAALHSQAFLAEDQEAVSSVRQSLPQNTQCFTCSRLYFGKYFDKCPRCGSDAVRHYGEDELGLLSGGPEDALSAGRTGATR